MAKIFSFILMVLLLLIMSACAVGEIFNPEEWQPRLLAAWQKPAHATWELEWRSGPVRSPLVFEFWQQGDQNVRIEIVQADIPALVGETLVENEHAAWRYNLYEGKLTLIPRAEATLPLISDALKFVGMRLREKARSGQANTLPIQGVFQEQIKLEYDDGGWLELQMELRRGLINTIEMEKGSLRFRLYARAIEPLNASPLIFTPFEFSNMDTSIEP